MLEKDGALIGQNVFVRAAIHADDGRTIPIAAMGSICIAGAYKRQSRGKLLLDFTLERARAYGIKAVCFEGNIDFCGKSGFDYASRFGIRYPGLPEGADASFFLCREPEAGYLDGVNRRVRTLKLLLCGRGVRPSLSREGEEGAPHPALLSHPHGNTIPRKKEAAARLLPFFISPARHGRRKAPPSGAFFISLFCPRGRA